MRGLSPQRGEEIEVAARMLEICHRVRLETVHHIGEFDMIVDEEHREIIAYKIKIADFSKELYGESSRIAHSLWGALRVNHSTEPCEDLRLLGSSEKRGVSEMRDRIREFENAVCGYATGMHDTFRDTFHVEAAELLEGVYVLQKQRS